jgi:hypothetical protein
MRQVLIPFKRPGVLFSLAGLLVQTTRDFSVLIRDEGEPGPADAYNQILVDALAREVAVEILRRPVGQGVFVARRELFEASTGEELVWLDSDLFLAHDAMVHVALKLGTYSGPVKGGFWDAFCALQGAKYEVYASRKYQNEINSLGSNLNELTPQEVRQLLPSHGMFCDMAIAVMRRADLEEVPWDQMPAGKDLAGEDPWISGHLVHQTKRPVHYDPALFGYHLAGKGFGWSWEVPTDKLIAELLRKQGVHEQIVRGIYG